LSSFAKEYQCHFILAHEKLPYVERIHLPELKNETDCKKEIKKLLNLNKDIYNKAIIMQANSIEEYK